MKKYQKKRENKNWEPYWKDKNTKLVHFIGKDNIVFHCIIFPIILKAHGDYILPENVPANEFLNLEGNKFSTSKNWAIWLEEFLVDFPGMQDSLRYTLTVNAPETKDNDFTWKDFQARNNNELVSILGNFINRVIVLTNKYWNGEVPKRNLISEEDKIILNKISEFPDKIGESIENYKFREGLYQLIDLARLGNKYLADQEPWKIIKTDKKRVETIMSISLEITSFLGVLLMPFLPESAKKIQTILGVNSDTWFLNDDWKIKSQKKIGEPHILFSKIEDSMVEEEVGRLQLNSL